MIRTIIVLLLASAACLGDYPRELVRFSSEREAWLVNDLDTAIKETIPQAQLPEANVITLYNLGYLYYLKGNYSQALPYLLRALTTDSSYPYPYYIIAKIYKESGNSLGALTQIKRGLEHDAKNYSLLMELAQIYLLLGEVDQAQQVYTKIVGWYEDKVAPRVALSQIYRSHGKLQEAKKILEENESLYPESTILVEKAKVYRSLGSLSQGAKFLIQLCQDYPNDITLQAYRDTLRLVYQYSDIKPAEIIPRYKYKIQPNESLDYKVKYGFITLGWLKIRMEEATFLNGRKVYPIIFFVDSNPAFDFLISLHHIYESYIDAENLNSVRTRIYLEDDTTYLTGIYYFEYEKNNFQAQLIYADGRFDRVVKPLPRRAQDGTSMLYLARGLVSNGSDGTTTVVIDEEYKFGHITYLNEIEEVDVKGEDTEAIKIFAKAEFNGIAGMNGDAWGWFSKDGKYIPLIGKIKILIGSITVAIYDQGE